MRRRIGPKTEFLLGEAARYLKLEQSVLNYCPCRDCPSSHFQQRQRVLESLAAKKWMGMGRLTKTQTTCPTAPLGVSQHPPLILSAAWR